MMRRPSLRQILPGAFWLGVVFEALATLLALLRIPPDPKHAILAGFSLSRLILLIGVAGVALFSVSMVFASRQSRVTRSWKALLFDDQRRTGWLLFAAVSIDSICAWLLLLPPPHFQGAIIERLRPILVLALLVTIQALAICLWADQRRITTAWTALWRGLSEFLDRPGVGAGLLAFSFGIGLATLYFTYYNMADEGDTITVGWLISQGQVLYRDIFSHHFPFAYLWVGAVFRLFGPSILAARLSVVVFRTALFAASMKLSRMFFPTGLIAVVWSLDCGGIMKILGKCRGFFILYCANEKPHHGVAEVTGFSLPMRILHALCVPVVIRSPRLELAKVRSIGPIQLISPLVHDRDQPGKVRCEAEKKDEEDQ
ncbi:MAG: hypothetical protein M1281_18235 [Chloroflexi bacterium]|nr:hypothetical protein [Chloroflexota bacterium]